MRTLLCLVLVMLVQRGNGIEQAAERLEELHGVVHARSASSRERAEALQECLALRAQVLAEEEFDAAVRAQWLADQAEDLLSRGLGLDRLGLTLLFGYPSSAESAQGKARVNAGLAMVSKSELAVEQAIFDLERIPASKRSAMEREHLLHLREQERDRRLPLLRGVGLVYRGEAFEADAVRTSTMREAASVLEGLDERLDGPVAAKAAWLHGLALARLDQYEAAEDMFRKAATAQSATGDDVLAARLGGVVNRAHQGGTDRGVRSAQLLQQRYKQPSQVRDHLLIIDHVARLHAGNGRLEEAATAWSNMHPSLVAAGLDVQTARALLDDRARRLVVVNPARVTTPDLLLAHAGRSDLDPRSVATSLRVLLSSSELEEDRRARVMTFLGAALVRDGRALEAAEVLLELATSMPGRREAGPAIDLASRLSLERCIADPTDTVARQLAVESLDGMMLEFPDRPGIDGWRLAAGRLAAGDGRWADAQQAYSAIAAGSPEHQPALRESAAVLLEAARDTQQVENQDRDIIGDMRSMRLQGDAATKTIIDLLLIEALLDAGHAAEAAESIRVLAINQLDAAQKSKLETLRLRAAEGDAESLAEAARGVAERGGADGGLAIASSLRQVLAAVEAASARTGEMPTVERVQAEIEPLSDALADWLNEQQSDDATSWLLVAQGLRRAGRSTEALVIVDRMLVLHPDAGELLFERAENLFVLAGEERLAQAMSIYRRLGQVSRESGARRWWWSQLRMLEILALLDRNTERIGPRIRRLRAEDEQLGGADVKRGFEALLIRYR